MILDKRYNIALGEQGNIGPHPKIENIQDLLLGLKLQALKSLTSLDKEVRPFFPRR